MNIENTQAQMRKGILEYCILLIIAQKDAYVPDIISRLKSSRMIDCRGHDLPLLTRLKNTGCFHIAGRNHYKVLPRKYYSITETGREFLKELETSWDELTSAVNSIKENHNS